MGGVAPSVTRTVKFESSPVRTTSLMLKPLSSVPASVTRAAATSSDMGESPFLDFAMDSAEAADHARPRPSTAISLTGILRNQVSLVSGPVQYFGSPKVVLASP